MAGKAFSLNPQLPLHPARGLKLVAGKMTVDTVKDFFHPASPHRKEKIDDMIVSDDSAGRNREITVFSDC
jgi:hypothetical protein